jgi:hypothetical protein
MDHPAAFIAQTALHGLVINCANAIYMAMYAVLAQRHSLAVSVALPFAVWLAVGTLVVQLDWNTISALAAVIATCVVCVLYTRDYRHAPMPLVRRRWYDIPLRALLVAALVGAVIVLSFRLGPQRTGALAAAPIAMTSIMILMHARMGGRAAAAVIANSLPGLGALLTFLLAINLAAVPLGVLAALLLGFVISIAWNVMLYVARPRPAAI